MIRPDLVPGSRILPFPGIEGHTNGPGVRFLPVLYSRAMHPVLFSTAGADFMTSPFFTGLAAVLLFIYISRRRAELGMGEEELWRLMLALVLGVFLGAWLLRFFLFGKGPAGNWAELLSGRVRGGVFYGGFWGGVLAAWLHARRERRPFAPLADALSAAVWLALAVQRLGCLAAGCCYGRPTDLPWGIVFAHPRSRVPAAWRGLALHPTQLLELAGALAIFLVLRCAVLPRIRRGELRAGTGFALSVALYGALRFGCDFLRGGPPGLWTPGGLTTTQAISAAAFCGSAAWLALRGRR